MDSTLPLPQLAHALAAERGTSLLILEARSDGAHYVVEDAGSFRESEGRITVLLAFTTALAAVTEKLNLAYLDELERGVTSGD